MLLNIEVQCTECEGYGVRFHQIAVDEYAENDCHSCDGSGRVVYREMYDSLEDATKDYPEAFVLKASSRIWA
jgi:DnaJ-class molecular chaperone